MEAYPVVFINQNHFSYQLCGLPFLSIAAGMAISYITNNQLTTLSKHVRIPYIEPPGGTPVDSPEASLKVALLGM